MRYAATGVMMTALAVGGAMPALSQDAGDYPQWRGPNRDGAAAGFAAPTSWPRRLIEHWQVETGRGYATPILIGNRVFTFGRIDTDEVAMALDAGTGAVEWRTAYNAPYRQNAGTQRHGPGPKSTPLYHDGRLFTLGINGVVSAFDADTGALLWQKPAQSSEPLYATSLSPVADGTRVILHVGGHDDGALTAYTADTGAVAWEWRGDGPAYASPMVALLNGVRQVVTVTQTKVVGVDANDGQLLWERPWVSRSTNNSITPIIDGNEVIVTGHELGVIRFRPLQVNDRWTTETIWQTDDVSMFMSNPVLSGDTLYGMSHLRAGQFFALDAATGETLWRTEGREATNSSVVMADELLFLLNNDGDLVVARTDRDGFSQITRYEVAESATWAQPAISGNRLFIKDEAHVTLWTIN
jgi:outer membrane protein assembly factor BamB